MTQRRVRGRGRAARETNRPPRYEFVMGLADLITNPDTAARLKVPEKTTKKVLGPKPDAWCESTKALATLSTRVWLWDTNSPSWSNVGS